MLMKAAECHSLALSRVLQLFHRHGIPPSLDLPILEAT